MKIYFSYSIEIVWILGHKIYLIYSISPILFPSSSYRNLHKLIYFRLGQKAFRNDFTELITFSPIYWRYFTKPDFLKQWGFHPTEHFDRLNLILSWVREQLQNHNSFSWVKGVSLISYGIAEFKLYPGIRGKRPRYIFLALTSMACRKISLQFYLL